MTLPHYWYLFLVGMFGSLGGACGMFGVFFQKITMGLTLAMIGHLGVVGAVTCFFCVPVAGWLGDRYHPIRVVLWGLTLALLTTPINFIWVWWRPSPLTFYYCSMAQTIFLGCPIGMMCQMDLPMVMRILPKERFGQYCSCRVLLNSIVGMFSGAMGGAYLDILTKHYGEKTAYCFIPFWSFVFNAVALFFMYKLYFSWKRLGGDESYVAPIPDHSQAEVAAIQMEES
jgi:nitrate/nitrite transporter NarK